MDRKIVNLKALTIREAGAEDADAIRSLTRAAYAKWIPLIGREPLPMAADYDEAVRNHRFDLVVLEGELLALIETIARSDHLLIENLAVAPALQGRGLGRRLMAQAEHVAGLRGLTEIRLYTNKRFEQNIQLYRTIGFRVDRQEGYRGGVVVHMSKMLRP